MEGGEGRAALCNTALLHRRVSDPPRQASLSHAVTAIREEFKHSHLHSLMKTETHRAPAASPSPPFSPNM